MTYVALPPDSRAPGIVLLPPIFGVEPVIQTLADRYAQAAGAFHSTQIGASLADAPGIHAPLSLHCGAEDPVAPMSEVEAIEAALREKPDAEVFVYPGTTHNFAVPGVPGYDAAVAELAEQRAFAFFDRLKTSG